MRKGVIQLTKLILRMLLTFQPETQHQQLIYFFDYCLPSLSQQIDSDFLLLIEYNAAITEELTSLLAKYPVANKNILFTKKLHPTQEAYLDSLDLSSYDNLRFVMIYPNHIYPANFTTIIREADSTPSILTYDNNHIFYPTINERKPIPPICSNSFVFICPPLEYTKLFRIYDNWFPFSINRYYMKMEKRHLPIDVTSISPIVNVTSSPLNSIVRSPVNET